MLTHNFDKYYSQWKKITNKAREQYVKHSDLSDLPDLSRGGNRTATTSKVELFAIIVNDFQSFTIITKSSTLDIVAVPDLPICRSVFGTLKSVDLLNTNTTK